jgi:hypothetical protein
LVAVLVVSLLVLFFAFLCFLAFMVEESVLDAVFWANTAVPDKRARPRAAVMIFFIMQYLLINNWVIALRAFNEYIRIFVVKES